MSLCFNGQGAVIVFCSLWSCPRRVVYLYSNSKVLLFLDAACNMIFHMNMRKVLVEIIFREMFRNDLLYSCRQTDMKVILISLFLQTHQELSVFMKTEQQSTPKADTSKQQLVDPSLCCVA